MVSGHGQNVPDQSASLQDEELSPQRDSASSKTIHRTSRQLSRVSTSSDRSHDHLPDPSHYVDSDEGEVETDHKLQIRREVDQLLEQSRVSAWWQRQQQRPLVATVRALLIGPPISGLHPLELDERLPHIHSPSSAEEFKDEEIISPRTPGRAQDDVGNADQKKTSLTPSIMKNALYIILNVASTIAIVFLNRIVVTDVQFRHCQILFGAWHFLCTFVMLFIVAKFFHFFEPVFIPILRILTLCILFCGFLVLTNLSLAHNPVGFYQLAKSLTAPTIVALNFILFRERISLPVFAAVITICVGVAAANGATAISNPLGMGIATVAFVVTATYQVWIKKRMGDLAVSASQLLLNQAGLSVFLLLIVAPVFDTMPDLSKVSIHSWGALLASGVVASLINLSQFLIIGAMSPLTFNAIGAVKLLGIVGLGWAMEGEGRTMLPIHEIVGIFLAIGGAWAYASALSREKKK